MASRLRPLYLHALIYPLYIHPFWAMVKLFLQFLTFKRYEHDNSAPEFQLGLQRIKINPLSRIILVYYCKCCSLIGYSTRCLFLDRLASSKTIIFVAHFYLENGFQHAFFNVFVQNFMFGLCMVLLKQLDYSLLISMR